MNARLEHKSAGFIHSIACSGGAAAACRLTL